jgi:asparagine synthase (glutamine-hydrolysing)
MCGFAGFVSPNRPLSNAQGVSELMGKAIRHRGPDGSGVWIDDTKSIGIVHRRLSIQDLSQHGAQPMARENYILAFNGEIYNHLELRKKLNNGSSISWKGHSDTETLLQGFLKWGIEKTLQRAIGMFAFALWDTQSRSLTLGRDRFGEKPLYYGFQNGTFLFGSDLAALKQHPSFVAEIDTAVLPLYLRYHYIPAPHSIYKGIKKLEAGQTLELSREDLASQLLPESSRYWSFDKAVLEAKRNPFEGSYSEAKRLVNDGILKSVSRQTISDVPLGAFLSGGIDSSTIVAAVQSQLTENVSTFTIGSQDQAFDESTIAKQIAKHLGTKHTEMIATPKDAIDCIPKLPSIYTEPFADASQIPTFMVSMLASQHVTVALSGDAGDEVFGGYNRYLGGATTWESLQRIPEPMRLISAKGLKSLSAHQWDSIFRFLGPALPKSLRMRAPGSNIMKMSNAMMQSSESEFYRSVTSRWQRPENVLANEIHSVEHQPAGVWRFGDGVDLNLAERMMAEDTVGYMTDDILTKVDRAAMFCSLETRVPFLDHELVELAWKLPIHMKIENGTGKKILRDIVHEHVPAEILDQPKTGFGIPIATWLKGPLRDWAENLLNKRDMQTSGLFDASVVHNVWNSHLSGKADNLQQLWPILMFQAWNEHIGQNERSIG